ncbi:MAG: hypothetical protein JO314_00745 [Acidobacteria bacterium]|nr:hypothetical protein [Acidobacteriota bacterium]
MRVKLRPDLKELLGEVVKKQRPDLVDLLSRLDNEDVEPEEVGALFDAAGDEFMATGLNDDDTLNQRGIHLEELIGGLRLP